MTVSRQSRLSARFQCLTKGASSRSLGACPAPVPPQNEDRLRSRASLQTAMTLPMRLNPILHVLGLMLTSLAVIMAIPALAEQAMTGQMPYEFIFSAFFCATVGLFATFATRDNQPFSLDVRQAFLLTALSWIVLPIFAALPLMGLGLSPEIGLNFTDAVFETVSGMTTTGSTVITGLDDLLPGLLLWRSLLQWIGGVGIIVMAIIMLPFLRIGGMQLFKTESSDKSEKIIPQAATMVKWIMAVYAGLTLLATAVFMLTGMGGFDAINHAMTALSTGGYSTHDASFGYFTDMPTQWAGTIFMLAGGLPFISYIKFVRGHRRPFLSDPQITTFLKFLGVVIITMTIWLMLRQDIGLMAALTMTAFNVVSVVTTTGYASADYTTWGPAAVAAFFILTFVGGCAGSTSGAIKIYRFQVLWVTMREQLLRLSSPNRVVVMRYHGSRLPADLPVSVLAFLAVFLASVIVVTVLLALLEVDFVTALTAATTAVTNVGPGLGEIVGPSGNFASLPDAAKWVLSFAMLLGRLEVFTLLLLFDPHFWRE